MKTREPSERLIKAGRAIFATTGLRRVLAKEDLRITKADLTAAVKVEPTIRTIVRDFLDGKREAVPMPKYDHEDLENLLFTTMDAETFTEKMAPFRGRPLGDDYMAAANNAVTFLRARAPQRFRATFLGPRPTKASQGELMGWRQTLETVGNPIWAVRQLLAATLSTGNVATLAEMWPDVLQAARRDVDEEIGERLVKDPDLMLSRRQIRQLAALTGNDPTAPPDLVQALQDAFAVQPRRTREGPPAKPPGEQMQTTLQRTANR